MDALELLRNDHVAVRGLLADLQGMAAKETHETKRKIRATVALIEREVKIHSELEETVLYPAFRREGDQEKDTRLWLEAIQEHDKVDKLLPALKVLAGRRNLLASRARKLESLLVSHMDMEERHMFARAREIFSPEQLDALGRQITLRKEELYKSWTGTLTQPLHRAKSLIDMITPLGIKRRKIERYTKRLPALRHD